MSDFETASGAAAATMAYQTASAAAVASDFRAATAAMAAMNTGARRQAALEATGFFQSIVADADRHVDEIEIEVTDTALVDEHSDDAAITAEDDGFIARLDPEDEVTVTMEDDVEGDLLVLRAAHVSQACESSSHSVDFALNLYIMPKGRTLPSSLNMASEAELMSELGLERIGEVDLGTLTTETDPDTGEVTVLTNTRKPGMPQILSNRSIYTASATFA